MPYFKSSNLLFIHIPKNAGKSIEQAFIPGLRLHTKATRSKQNSIAKLMLDLTTEAVRRDVLIGTLDYSIASQHMTLQELSLLGCIDRLKIDETRTFAIFRNPLERFVSTLHHFYDENNNRANFAQGAPRLSGPDDLDNCAAHWFDHLPRDHNQRAHMRPQTAFIKDCNGVIAVQNLLRFERLNEDFGEMCRKLHIVEPKLPWVGKRRSGRDIAYSFGSRINQKISQFYEEDFSIWEGLQSEYSART